jgi:hypothetical protein
MIAAQITQKLHGADIYAGFVPTFALDLQGWNSVSQAFEDIIGRNRPEIVVDVGVWKGGSTIHLANLLRKHEIDGAVIAVDTFLGSVEHNILDGQFGGLIPRQFGRLMLYEQFLSNVVRSGARDRIVPLPATSAGGAALLKRTSIRPGLVHIDAAHDYASVLADAIDYWDILAPGGYLVGDDYGPAWPGVVKAADAFSAQIGIPLRTMPPKWIMQKP